MSEWVGRSLIENRRCPIERKRIKKISLFEKEEEPENKKISKAKKTVEEVYLKDAKEKETKKQPSMTKERRKCDLIEQRNPENEINEEVLVE